MLHRERRESIWKGIVPTPDPAFLKDMKEFDPTLSIEFSREVGLFVIYQHSKQYGKVAVLNIQDENGAFRQPITNIDLGLLYWGDMWRHGGVKARLIFGEEKARQTMEDDDKRAQDTFREAATDDKYTLRRGLRRACGIVDDAPHVRRIEPKPRGYVVKDSRKFARKSSD